MTDEHLEFGRVLQDAGHRTGFALTLLGESFSREVAGVLSGFDLKPRQLRILDLLADRGPIGQRELAHLMAVDHSVLVHLLNPLEQAKLVKRERDESDRRRHVVTIARAGERRLAEADHAFREVEARFFGPLSPEERETLHALLVRLRAAAAGSGDSDC